MEVQHVPEHEQPDENTRRAARAVGVLWRLREARESRYAPLIANVAAFLAFCFILGQFWILQQSVQASREAEKPAVFIIKLEPAKKVFYRGDLIKMRATYQTDKANLVCLVMDSFENVDTQEVYQGQSIVRVFVKAGTNPVGVVRVMPDYLEPGRYRLIGWVQGQTSVRSVPSAFQSGIFEVK